MNFIVALIISILIVFEIMQTQKKKRLKAYHMCLVKIHTSFKYYILFNFFLQ